MDCGSTSRFFSFPFSFLFVPDESTLSKSMTVAAGNSQFQSHRMKGSRGAAATGNGGISDEGHTELLWQQIEENQQMNFQIWPLTAFQ